MSSGLTIYFVKALDKYIGFCYIDIRKNCRSAEKLDIELVR